MRTFVGALTFDAHQFHSAFELVFLKQFLLFSVSYS